MFLDLFIALLSGLQLWLAPATGAGTMVAPVAQSTQRPALRVAQAAPATAATTADRAARQVSAALGQRRAIASEKRKLTAAHHNKIVEVDRLKRRRASWRRDRQLKSALADSQQTAHRLSSIARRLRAIDLRLISLRMQLEKTAKAELRAGTSTSRSKRLRAWVRASRRALRRQRRIVLPDDAIDLLADPEDLDYQAQRLAQSERELEREIRAMVAREKRYDRMARLRSKATRAAELSRLDDDRPRRSTGRVGGGGDRAQDGASGSFENDGTDGTAGTDGIDDAAGSPTGDADPDTGAGGEGPGFGTGKIDPVVVLADVLADVVDTRTLSALRRAESSGDPRVKAAATLRARKQVQKQLQRLRTARAKIQKRARTLRRR